MKNSKRLFCLVLALLMLAVCSVGAFADAPYSEARNSVVRILTKIDGEYFSTGSGFCVGVAGENVQYIVTNSHVINIEYEGYIYEPDALEVIFDGVSDQTTLQATVVKDWQYWVEGQPDLAIIKLVAPTTLRRSIPLMPSGDLELTQPIYALGFPYISDYDYLELPSRVEDVSVINGTVTKQLYQGINGSATYFQMNVDISGGNSGGPVVTEDGYAVGISSYSSTVASGFNYALYTEYIIDYLTTMGIDFDHSTKAEAKSSLPIPLWALIAIIALVVIAAAAVVIFFVSKKKKAPQPAMAAGPVPGQAPGGMSRTQAVSRQAPGLAVTGLSGSMSGRSFQLTAPLVFGRDPARCTVCYAASTPGVSAVHCTLKGEGDIAVLVDNGSSYGTFLDNGTKLTPNQEYRLARGTRFYLASKDNGFVVQ